MRKVLELPNEESKTMDMYITSSRPGRSKRSQLNSTTPDKQRSDSSSYLPAIQNGQINGKLNDIRNQTSRGKQNIMLLEARLRALRKQKEKNNKQAQWAKQKVEFITTIRNRCDEDDKRKREERQKKQLECAYLKKKADQFKETHRNNKDFSMTTLNSRKAEDGRSVRNLSKQNDLQLQLIKQRDEEVNHTKAEDVRKMQEEIERQLKKYENSRREMARSNHMKKLAEALKEKHKTYKQLTKLNEEEQCLIDQLKTSETAKISEFRNLHNMLNPEQGGNKGSFTSRRNKSVYAGMYRRLLQEIDKKQSTISEITPY